MQHILDAVPIDKYFEMFKPGSGSDGGFVRLKMRLMSNSDMKREKGGRALPCCLQVHMYVFRLHAPRHKCSYQPLYSIKCEAGSILLLPTTENVQPLGDVYTFILPADGFLAV